MPSLYSDDLSLRVIKAIESGKMTREVSALHLVSHSFVSKFHQLWKRTGLVQSKQQGGYKRTRLAPYGAVIKVQLLNYPSMTLKELQSWLAQEHSVNISISAIDKLFIRSWFTAIKKTVTASTAVGGCRDGT